MATPRSGNGAWTMTAVAQAVTSYLFAAPMPVADPMRRYRLHAAIHA